MQITKTFPLLAATFFTVNAHAVTTTYFSSDFDTAIDTGSAIQDSSGRQLTTVFGDPALVGGALQFNLGGASLYEQLQLNMAGAASTDKIFSIKFDLYTENLANSGYGSTLHVDTPTVQNLNFNNCCSNSISTFNSGATSPIGQLGTLTDGQWMNVAIDINLIDELWSIDISGVGSGTGGFYTSGGGIESLRMSLSPALGSITTANSSINVYVDNLSVVSTVPLPASVWLFGTGLVGLIGFAKRKNS